MIIIFQRVGCTEGSLTIWDGSTQHNICNVLLSYQRESQKNQMYVQFRAGWLGIGQARCRARAIQKSFLDALSGEIDSKEHGQGIGTKSTTCPCGWTNKVT